MLLSQQCYCPRMPLKIDQKIFHVRHEVRDKRIQKKIQTISRGGNSTPSLWKENWFWMKYGWNVRIWVFENNINSSGRDENLNLYSDLIRIRLRNSAWMLLLMLESQHSFVLFRRNAQGKNIWKNKYFGSSHFTSVPIQWKYEI